MREAGGILAVAIVIGLYEREWRPRLRLPAIGLITAGFVWLSCRMVDWRQIGRCLFALALAYSLFCIVSFFGRTRIQQNVVIVTGRALLGVLATTLMTRMILNARIYHYGFYQAALAAALVPYVINREILIWLGGR